MRRTLLKRPGQRSGIADTVAYLDSDATSYITGELVVLDGGRMALNCTVAVWSVRLMRNLAEAGCCGSSELHRSSANRKFPSERLADMCPAASKSHSTR
jgi:hypothetical protein